MEVKKQLLKDLLSTIVYYICSRYRINSVITSYVINWLYNGIDKLRDDEVNYIVEQIKLYSRNF
ncbi:MAG: hypothetical protein QW607_05670 [Desulfurococcaceae archaeon]